MEVIESAVGQIFLSVGILTPLPFIVGWLGDRYLQRRRTKSARAQS